MTAFDKLGAPSPLNIALDYIGRGWNPTPIKYQEKGPTEAGWQSRVIDANNASRYFNGERMNIGVILGPSSQGLTDIDLDCNEALAISPYILPKTGAIFGRASSRASHRLYYTDLSASSDTAVMNFNDPATKERMLELRIGGGGKGAQTIFPGSTHKETAEPIEWDERGKPALVDDDDLLRRVRDLAAYSLIARNWPKQGGRHECALVVGGFLARAGKSALQIKIAVEAIAKAAGDEEWRNRRDAAEDAVEARHAGKHAYGLASMRKMFGDVAANQIGEWLDYRGGEDPRDNQSDDQSASRNEDLPELVISGSAPTAAAKELAALIAKRDDFLFNGNAPVRIAIEADSLPRALEVTNEAVRFMAHQVCNPVKLRKGVLGSKLINFSTATIRS